VWLTRNSYPSRSGAPGSPWLQERLQKLIDAPAEHGGSRRAIRVASPAPVRRLAGHRSSPQALDIASSNGYDLCHTPPDDVAYDLAQYNSALEQEWPEVLLP
jgi:hypothetical protein